jgi:LDH2 family malate/lactate/ureidoglycolate dehydrogenase
MILPMAHHKGYAIATLMDVLAGVLSGSQFLDGVHSPYHFDQHSGAGHFLAVYDVDAFMDMSEYQARITRFVQQIKTHPRAQGVQEIFYPGEMEARVAERQLTSGIALPIDTWRDLCQLAKEANQMTLLNSSLV